jgi:hypothetical protein
MADSPREGDARQRDGQRRPSFEFAELICFDYLPLAAIRPDLVSVRKARAETCIRTVLPLIVTRFFWTFGSQYRFVRFFACETLCPNERFLPVSSHFIAVRFLSSLLVTHIAGFNRHPACGREKHSSRMLSFHAQVRKGR